MGLFGHPELKIPMPDKLQLPDSGLSKLQHDKLALADEDAIQIINGSNSAATDYLRIQSGDSLHRDFLSIVQRATSQAGVTEQYKNLTGKPGNDGIA